jgi:hypothetical protein
MDIIKTIGIEIRFTITPFIKKVNLSLLDVYLMKYIFHQIGQTIYVKII